MTDVSGNESGFDSRLAYMIEIETKLNIEIGYRFWKKYVTAAFWSYISMPLNLAITMMTALSTGQAATDNLLPKSIYINISLATLVVSVLNTYFRPYVQMNQNIDYMNKWSVMGFHFEEIYYGEKKTLAQINHRIEQYAALMKDINELKKTEILETQNFLTDSIHLALRSCYCCLKNKNSWLALDETLKKEDADAKNGPPRSDFDHMNLAMIQSENVIERAEPKPAEIPRMRDVANRVMPIPAIRTKLLSNIRKQRSNISWEIADSSGNTGTQDNV